MEQFNRFYLWGAETKARMGLYTVAVVFFKGLADTLAGRFSVDYLILLEMLAASFAFACIESAIFPPGRGWEEESRGRRIALWAASANGIYIGCALVFGWFSGLSTLWCAALVVILELALAGMVYVIRLTAERDTRQLNEKLEQFQTK